MLLGMSSANSIHRIHILGAAGSGKTYLSEKLSNNMGLPAFDLDRVFWNHTDNDYTVKASPSQRDTTFQAIVDADEWITEGVYTSWIGNALGRADCIVVLDASGTLCTFRILFRFVLRRLGIVKLKKKETLSGLFSLLSWNRTYIRERVPAIREDLKQYAPKVIFTTKADRAYPAVLALNRLTKERICSGIS
jgi:adenylate kinase family enzyme